jgi:hypothetical protein
MTFPPNEHVPAAERNPLLFIKEVAKYFMDFLETDFHKQRAPRRVIRSRDPNSLLVGLSLRKYPTINPKIWHLISHTFPCSLLNEISRRAYRTEIPRGLLELIRLQTERISQQAISKIVSAIAEEISHVAVSLSKEYDRGLSLATDAAIRAIQRELVFPLISNVEQPLLNLELGDENRVFLMQEELTTVLSELLTNKISELLRLALSEQHTDAQMELQSVFDLNDVKSSVDIDSSKDELKLLQARLAQLKSKSAPASEPAKTTGDTP